MKEIHEMAYDLQKEIDSLPGVLNKSPNLDLFDVLITDSNLKKSVEKLFKNGHHARAVEEAYKYIDNLVRKKSGIPTLTGSKLMQNVFSVDAPKIKLNSNETISEKDEQLGYMMIFSGAMTGIRNPRAHECNWEDNETRALQLIVLANHLIEKINFDDKE
jgi:uncharacterized protein (TIGR02391 family)